jgi:hypothetical protein
MKITDEDDPIMIPIQKKIDQYFSVEEKNGLLNSLLGMSKLLSEFLMKEYHPLNLPRDVSYAIVQVYGYLKSFSAIIHDKIEGEKIVAYMPTGEGSWQSEEDFDARLLFVVKAYYAMFKQEGKI